MPAQVIITVLIIWGLAEILTRVFAGFSITLYVTSGLRSLFEDLTETDSSREEASTLLRKRKRDLSRTSSEAGSVRQATIVTRELAAKKGELADARAELGEAEGELAQHNEGNGNDEGSSSPRSA